MKLPMQHMVQHNGHKIYCDGGKYYIPQNPAVKYKDVGQAIAELDKIDKSFNENILNLTSIVQLNTTNGHQHTGN